MSRLDRIESMENAAEGRLDEMTKGLPPGKYRCDCGRIDELAHASASGVSPYSAPMCRHCLEELFKEKGYKHE